VYPLNREQSLALNQFEWVNPHPEKKVRRFEVESRYDFAPVLVVGVTVRGRAVATSFTAIIPSLRR
jgi:hypothetical protein